MKSLLFKVEDKIKDELEIIREEEGLGTQTATLLFLVKYYLLTKKTDLDATIKAVDRVLDRIDLEKLPDLKEQLKDL